MSISSPRRKLQDPITVRRLATALLSGASRAEALGRVGVSQSTFYREMRRSPDLKALVDNEHASAAAPSTPAPQVVRTSRAGKGTAASRRHSAVHATKRSGSPDSAGSNPSAETSAAEPEAGSTPVGEREVLPKTKRKRPTSEPASPGQSVPEVTAAARPLQAGTVSSIRAVKKPLHPSATRASTVLKASGERVRHRPSRDARVRPLVAEVSAGEAVPTIDEIRPEPQPASVADAPKWRGLTGLVRHQYTIGVSMRQRAAEAIAGVRSSTFHRWQSAAPPSGGDWMPPAVVLLLQLVVAIAVGAHPLISLGIALSTLGVVVAVRLARQPVPAGSHPTEIRYPAEIVERAAPPGATPRPAAAAGDLSDTAGAPPRSRMDLRWVAASFRPLGSPPDDPHPPRPRG